MTAEELFNQAVRLAYLDNKEWPELTLSERAAYGDTARRIARGRNTDGSILFPSWVAPTTPCLTATMSRLAMTPHGTVRIELPLKNPYFYICRADDGKMYANALFRFAAEPCGPECVNR